MTNNFYKSVSVQLIWPHWRYEILQILRLCQKKFTSICRYNFLSTVYEACTLGVLSRTHNAQILYMLNETISKVSHCHYVCITNSISSTWRYVHNLQPNQISQVLFQNSFITTIKLKAKDSFCITAMLFYALKETPE